MNIAVIPARGGSKRIPRKNIKPFYGKPMIAWSIAAAQASQVFDRIIVSTDDQEIADTAQALGADVPFLRPPELSDDFTGTIDVIAHATQWALDEKLSPSAVCCIYATAPFIQYTDIQEALTSLQQNRCSYVFTATEFAAPVYRSFQQNTAGGVEMLYPEHFNTRSQDLPEVFHDAGQFYWGTPQAWLSHQPFFSGHSRLHLIPRWRVQDIDNEADWVRAEAMAAALLSRQS